MSWIKQLEAAIEGIPDRISSNDVIRQALRVLRRRPCYRAGDELYNADLERKKGSDLRKVTKS